MKRNCRNAPSVGADIPKVLGSGANAESPDVLTVYEFFRLGEKEHDEKIRAENFKKFSEWMNLGWEASRVEL